MRFLTLALFLTTALMLPGCDKKPAAPPSTTVEDSHDHDGHDHDHDHDHGHDHAAHGPNGGHLFKFDSDKYQGESNDSIKTEVIKMYILDMDKNPVALKVDSFRVIPLAGNDPTPFELQPVDPDDEGKASVFQLDDERLRIAVPLGVSIEVKMGDETMTGKIESHEPYDH